MKTYPQMGVAMVTWPI